MPTVRCKILSLLIHRFYDCLSVNVFCCDLQFVVPYIGSNKLNMELAQMYSSAEACIF